MSQLILYMTRVTGRDVVKLAGRSVMWYSMVTAGRECSLKGMCVTNVIGISHGYKTGIKMIIMIFQTLR
mgnify:CR=1 FL=1